MSTITEDNTWDIEPRVRAALPVVNLNGDRREDLVRMRMSVRRALKQAQEYALTSRTRNAHRI